MIFLYVDFISYNTTEFIYSFSGGCRLWGSLYTMSFANWDSLTSSFSIWMPFIYFLAWSFWLGLPALCWIEMLEVGTFVFLQLSEEKFQLPTVEYVSCGLVPCAFITLRYIPSILCLLRVFILKNVEFCQMFFLN